MIIREIPDGAHAHSPKPNPTLCLSVCSRCKPMDWRGNDHERPGAAFAVRVAEALKASKLPESVALRDILCMSQCKRPCVVAFSGDGRFSYLFGDLDPDMDAEAVIEGFALYAASDDGFVERAKRPRALQAGILGRIPPLSSAHRIIHKTTLTHTASGASL
ncbi:COG5469 Predicted metal-binding protein [Rhabdaerophilaceae bacterium]